MDKKELVRSIASLLKEKGIKRPISIPKQVFTFSDNEGHSKDFVVKKRDKFEIYTVNDISNIIDAALYIIKEQIKRGGEISVYGFGKLGVTYRKPRISKNVNTGQDVYVQGRYVPHFEFGNELRKCAKVYGLSLNDKAPEIAPLYEDADYVYDEDEEGDSVV